MRKIVEKACAKLNLGLKILGKRSDGYHDLVSIFQTVDLHDCLQFEPIPSGKIELICRGADLPTGEDNLVYRAAALIRKRSKAGRGVRIRLEKRIPVGAGLGGGSSDAAATLRVLNRLWDVNLDAGALCEMAEILGSDVPFFLRSGTAVVKGRGERLSYVSGDPQVLYILVYPGFEVSTGWAFQNLKLDLTKVSKYITFSNSVEKSGRVSTEELLDCLENDFLFLIESCYPQVRDIRARLKDLGAAATSLSGSGSTVYGVFLDPAGAMNAHMLLAQEGYQAYCCRPVFE